MLIQTILAYLPYALITAITPGPNNILSFYAVSQGGWKRGKETLLGIGAGFLVVMTVCALFCRGLSLWLPALTRVLRYVGVAYLLWLAFHIARSAPSSETAQAVSFWRACVLQFVNVKIILYAITVYTAYVLPVTNDWSALLLHALWLTALGCAGVLSWAAAGGLFQAFLARYHRPFHLVMAALLVLCAGKLLF